MEIMDNTVFVCDDLMGFNIVEEEDGSKYISLEFDHDPEIQIHLTKKDLEYFFKRVKEENNED